jgi:hypothetical protein
VSYERLVDPEVDAGSLVGPSKNEKMAAAKAAKKQKRKQGGGGEGNPNTNTRTMFSAQIQ